MARPHGAAPASPAILARAFMVVGLEVLRRSLILSARDLTVCGALERSVSGWRLPTIPF